MNKVLIFSGLIIFFSVSVSAQMIRMTEKASINQIYGDTYQSEELMSMNELGIDLGYVLYESTISTDKYETELKIENVRDFAMIYIDGKPIGDMTGENNSISFQVDSGNHRLQIYVENIGRITYGPEIMDNSRGLFGEAFLNETPIKNWEMTILKVKDSDISNLQYSNCIENLMPGFYKGTFIIETPHDTNIDISSWGMGEIWINNQYVGSYWNENTEQSVAIPISVLNKGENNIIIFELKNITDSTIKLSDKPIFK